MGKIKFKRKSKGKNSKAISSRTKRKTPLMLMAAKRGGALAEVYKIENYEHKDKKRKNNPPVGLVNNGREPLKIVKKEYKFDPHLDPQLNWAGKVETNDIEVQTVSLHVHERIDTRTIIETVRNKTIRDAQQFSLFEQPEEKNGINSAVNFYKHDKNWTNRMIAGDSLLVMNSLVEKEGMGQKFQMIYMDPPYGIEYYSNFQPFVNKKSVKDAKDEDLTHEPEQITAFRDTWQLKEHSYLSYMRDRILLSRELLNETGSIFIQISDENVHRVRIILDEVFGANNFCSMISFAKTSSLESRLLYGSMDYILWYAKDKSKVKYNQLYSEKLVGKDGGTKYNKVELVDGTRRPITEDERAGIAELPSGARIFRDDNITSQGNPLQSFKYNGKVFKGTFKPSPEGMKKLAEANRIWEASNSLGYVRYLDDFPVYPINNYWNIGGIQSRSDPKIYVVQTSTEAVKRCILMTTSEGDLVFDPTCGSGTTAYVAEQWGRRWITCDTSRVAISLAKQRLMCATFPYYKLTNEQIGISSGLECSSVQRVRMSTFTQGEPPEEVKLIDQPTIKSNVVRVTGPFTLEAVPSQTVRQLDDPMGKDDLDKFQKSEYSWIDELRSVGIRGKKGLSDDIKFCRLDILAGTKFLHAEGETTDKNSKRVVISFGPEHAPLEQRQVELAIEEAGLLQPKPSILVFVSFQFDPEAAKDIDEYNSRDFQLLKVQMNPDLLTQDLKKKRISNESFFLMGQPDVEIKPSKNDKGKFHVSVKGWDYYNTRTGDVESGGKDRIAMWMLDTDYDGRSLFPKQVFFPLAASNEGWSRLAKTLKNEINEDLIKKYQGTDSIPFEPGRYGRVAVKIVDDRGIESLKIIQIPGHKSIGLV